MHEEILTQSQMSLAERLFPLMKDYYLAGGTALALQIGHRRSLDFDLASETPIRPFDIERKLVTQSFRVEATYVATTDELSILIQNTRVMFFYFPFHVPHGLLWDRGGILLPETLDLGAMKAYAVGRRSKWKDYVDLFFLLKYVYSVEELAQRAHHLFAHHFNSKLFREQLCYFEDIDYSESVDYVGDGPTDQEIKSFLQNVAVRI